MWTKIITWLFGTQMGRGVLLGGSIAIGIFIGWYFFSTHYYNEGFAECQADRVDDANTANVQQGRENIARNETSTDLAKETDAEIGKVISDAEKARDNSKESVTDVYEKPPVTAPVALGSCVHPLDDRVQARLDQARAAAAGT